MNYLDFILCIICTIFVLYGFVRVVFSIGEHLNKRPKLLPTILFMILSKLFLLGFVIFNILSVNQLSINWQHPEPVIHGSYLVSGFCLLTILEIIILNKQILIFDRYLYSGLDNVFPTWWRRSYKPLLVNKHKRLYSIRNAIHIFLVAQIAYELFFCPNVNDTFYIVLYSFYTFLYILMRRYFNSIC